MKIFKTAILLLALTIASAMPAKAQFKWGIQAGIVANDLKFSESVFDSNNRVGFTGGITAQFLAPIAGIGIQGSLMYVHRTNGIKGDSETMVYKKDYIVLPVHLKWRINLPFVKPFLFTGPSFGYMLSKAENSLGAKTYKGDIEWDLGFGAEIVNHLQLKAGYGIGCTKVMKIAVQGFEQKVRQNSWTITLGYLF